MAPLQPNFIAWQDKTAAIIPCFNEQANIARVIAAVREFIPHIIVVDDGSTDHTAEVARNAGATVLQHAARRGKGQALKTGWMAAKDREWALFLDGDGQHAAADIPAFLLEAERSPAKMIVGNRMHSTAAMPFIRRFVNTWMSERLSSACGFPVLDSQSGFRLVHLPTLLSLPIEAASFEIESELLLKFANAGARVNFVPIQTIYGRTRSHIRPIKDTIRWFQWWHRNTPAQPLADALKTTCKRT